jgi:hypothetical protein
MNDERGTDEFLVQRLHETRVPTFYDAGSSFPEEQWEYDEPPARDLLKLLEEL